MSEATVGNWIADPNGLDGRPDLDTLAARFRGAYVGRYPDRASYASGHLDDAGLATAIDELGIADYFDNAAYERDLFRNEVIGINPGTAEGSRGIEVFRRHPGP